MKSYLKSLVREREVEAAVGSQVMESGHERRHRLLDELFEDIRATRGGFRAADNTSREALHERDQPFRGRSRAARLTVLRRTPDAGPVPPPIGPTGASR